MEVWQVSYPYQRSAVTFGQFDRDFGGSEGCSNETAASEHVGDGAGTITAGLFDAGA
jgi:hypothetical protein